MSDSLAESLAIAVLAWWDIEKQYCWNLEDEPLMVILARCLLTKETGEA